MTKAEKDAWISLKQVVVKLLGNNNYPNLKRLVCLMTLKINLLNSHLDFSPENLGDVRAGGEI